MDRDSIKSNQVGFTLVEVMIVITIIGLLLLLAVLAYRSQIFKGYDARRKTDLHQIRVGLEEYEKDHECYPTALDCGQGTVLDPYMGGNVPCDPGTGDPYDYTPDSESGACPGWYWVFTDLDYEKDPGIIEIGCSTGCGPSVDETDYNYYISSPNAPDVFVAPYPKYACLPGNVCQGLLESENNCQPHYATEAACEALCPDQTTFCDG